MMHHYWAFGLSIQSAIEFPELMPTTTVQADLNIQLGEMPQSIAYPFTELPQAQWINEQEYLWHLPGIAHYYAHSGHTIVVKPLQPMGREIRLYLLATVMAAILHQRQTIPFHASGIRHNHGLCLFAGHSGAGKSTLLSGLMKKGYTVFSDDVVVLQSDTETISAIPSYPMIKLWDAAIDYLNDSRFAERNFLVKPGIDKYGIFFHEQFNTSPAIIQQLILLEAGEFADYHVQKLEGAEVFFELCKQVYRPYLLHGQTLLTKHFAQLSTLSQQASVLKISRPKSDTNPDNLLQLVEKALCK